MHPPLDCKVVLTESGLAVFVHSSGVYTAVIPGLGPGYHPWQAPRWPPSRQCWQSSPRSVQSVVMAVLQCMAWAARGAGVRLQCQSACARCGAACSKRIPVKLPRLPAELWHLVFDIMVILI